MAETWTAYIDGVTPATNLSMLGLFNGSGSGRVLRVYRIWLVSTSASAVTGSLMTIDVRTISALGTGGTVVTPIAHDTSNTALAAQIISYSGSTFTDVSSLYETIMSADELALGVATQEEMQMFWPLGLLWESGAIESNVQPIVLREGEGVHVKQTATISTAGSLSLAMEFTNAAS